MSNSRCPICNEPSAAGSRFCVQHRAQAALFAKSFAPDHEEALHEAERTRLRAHPDYAALTPSLAQAFEKAKKAPKRVPQIFVYVIDDKPTARTYFRAGAPASEDLGFQVAAVVIREAVAPGGVLFEAVMRAYIDRAKALHARSVYAVALELWPTEGRAVVVEWAREHERRELVSFTVVGDEITKQS